MINPATRLLPAALRAGLLTLVALALPTLANPLANPLASARDIDAEGRARLVERIAQELDAQYVFPDVAKRCGEHLRAELKAGKYDGMTRQESLASALTTALQSVSKDKHMRVMFRPQRARVEAEDPMAAHSKDMQRMRASNFGFERVEILDGNVGYVDMRAFSPIEFGRDTAAATMSFLANSDAIIFDMRQNGGGSPEMVQFICSYFFRERTHLNSLYYRAGDTTQEYWTLDQLPGKRLSDVPLFVLTSKFTFSAAEEFTYNLSTRERATLVGETTGGGANPGGVIPVGDGFQMFVPTGRAINPITGTNWEGVGIEPDVAVTSSKALDRAHSLARKAAREYSEFRTAERAFLWDEVKDRLQAAEGMFEDGRSEAGTKVVHAALTAGCKGELLDEPVINGMGLDYLRRDKTELSIAILDFNTQAYPASFNTWDSLGQAHMQAGNPTKAIESYQKSLALNPKNQNAVQMLKRLKEG